MKIDLLKYKHLLPIISTYIKQHPNESYCYMVSSIGIFTHCELIFIAYYLEKLVGKNEELSSLIDSLKSFYKYEEILNYDSLQNIEIT